MNKNYPQGTYFFYKKPFPQVCLMLLLKRKKVEEICMIPYLHSNGLSLWLDSLWVTSCFLNAYEAGSTGGDSCLALKSDSRKGICMVIWLWMAPVYSMYWTFGYQLVDCLEMIRSVVSLKEMCHWGMGGFWGSKISIRPNLALSLLSSCTWTSC